jgi:Domain of unknown function (DUF4129)/Domain of unknown function (DUF4350)
VRRAVLLPLAALTALAAVSALAPEARAEKLDATVRSVLADERYRFCHEDDYPLAPDEHAWCSIVGETNGACPSLAKACLLPPVPRTLSLFHGRGRHGQRGGPVDHGPQLDDRRRPPDLSFHLPDMSGFARVLFFVMIAGFVVLVIRALVQNVLKSRGDPESKDDAPPPEAPGEAAPAARGPVETDVDRLLARARAAADRGEYARAVDDCYAALLRRLDGDGFIEIHPSRTNGDYVRALGERPDLERAVKGIVRDVEGVQFGDTAPSEPLFRSVLARVVPLVGRGLALALCFLGLSVALSCTPHEGGDDEGRADTSPSGTQGLVEAFEKHGIKIKRRSEPLSQLDRPLALVLLPEATLDDAAWKDVLAWVKDKGGRLVLAGVTPLPAELEQRIVPDPGEVTALFVAPGVHWPGHPAVSLPHGARIVSTLGPTAGEGPPEGTVLLRGESAVVTERRLGEGRVVVVADERLFTNAALAVDEDASFALSILYRSSVAPEREVELCDAWTGAGAQTPMDSVSQAHLTPVVLQIFALMGLLFLWKGRAFARLRDPPEEGRRAFADHARALGLTYQRAHAARHVTGLYAVWALERLRERVHRAGRQGLIPLAEAIAARTGRPEGEVMSVLADAAGARDEAAPPSSFRPEPRRGPASGGAGKKDTSEPDLALMRELQGFLQATGSRRSKEPSKGNSSR